MSRTLGSALLGPTLGFRIIAVFAPGTSAGAASDSLRRSEHCWSGRAIGRACLGETNSEYSNIFATYRYGGFDIRLHSSTSHVDCFRRTIQANAGTSVDRCTPLVLSSPRFVDNAP